MTSQRRDSDICLTYSPIPPEGQNDDPESMFSPSRPIKKTFLSQLWAFRRRRSSNYDNIPRTIDSDSMADKSRRLIDRDGMFHQSQGKVSIRKKIKIREWRELYATDWFHSLVNSPTWKTILILLSAYIAMVVLFAVPYYFIGTSTGDVCHLRLRTFQEAFMFSLESMATIGYGTHDIFFGDCLSISIILTGQVCVRLISDALTIGVIYSRLSRATSRASTIIVSNNAVIRRINGKLYLMMQTCELRKHQLVEAHVRMYTLKKETDLYIREHIVNASSNRPAMAHSEGNSNQIQQFLQGVTYFQTCPMRISQPSDDRGAMLLLCLPQVIVHELNESSPLMPPRKWKSNRTGEIYDSSNDDRSYRSKPVVSLKSNPYATPPRSNKIKTTTAVNTIEEPTERLKASNSSQFDTTEMNMQTSYQKGEIALSVKTEESKPYASGDYIKVDMESSDERVEHNIKKYMEDRNVEIIVIIEGSDPATGGAVQCRHSYIPSEIQWHKTFAPCVFEDDLDGSAIIDFNLFHQLRDVARNSSSPGAVASFVV